MYSFRDYLTFGWQLINGFRIYHENNLAELRDSDLRPYLKRKVPLYVLDLANGRLRPQFIILESQKHRTFGIDLMNCPSNNWSENAYSMARNLFERRSNLPKGNPNGSPKLVCGDVNFLPYSDETFDMITSVAAFEHFLDVQQVISELFRVTKSEGLIWVWIHLFTSPSGAHNVSLMQIPLRTLPKDADSWDHIRKKKIPIEVPLNKWRFQHYLDAFSEYFEVLNYYFHLKEGEDLLTLEIEEDLPEFTRDELTSRAMIVVARKT